ncbi:MAG: hypothetical protein WED04_00240 [Promethearchaeati archaeon SRVP18_Atabeyarchaeia-1]
MPSPDDDRSKPDPASELRQLEYNYNSLLQERNRILAEMSSLGEALADCKKGKAELELSLRRIKDIELNPSFGEATTTRLKFLEQEVESLSRSYDEVESLLFRLLAAEPGVGDKAREFILRNGSIKHRALLILTERGSMDVNELARLAGLDLITINKAIEILLREGAVQIRGSLLAIPGALKMPDIEAWRALPTDKIFDEVEHYISLVRTPELVSQAIQALKELVEQRAKGGGTLVFEIGKEVQQWKRGFGNLQDLRYKISEWKQRAGH